MYIAVVVCVLIAAVSAEVVGEKPKQCCSPAMFTFEASGNDASLKDGKLFTEFGVSRGAYDSIDKLMGFEFVLDFSNGTEDIRQIILDYKKNEGFLIEKIKEEIDCIKFEVGVPFKYNCLPEAAVFVGSVSLGNKALQSDQWYFNDKESGERDNHVVFSVKSDECIPLGISQRSFDPATGDEIEFSSITYHDFSLGICDPDRWFKPPTECEEAKITAVPEERIRHVLVPSLNLN